MKEISPKDSVVAMTAEDLRRRYDLGGSGGNMNVSSSETAWVGSDGKINVITVDEAIWGDSRPISSGGVYNITGYIEKALENI